MPDDKLTGRQQRFVEEYLACPNATQAAIRAGYSPKTAKQAGARMLTFVDVREAIERAREKMREKTEVTVETMTEHYEALARSAPKDSDKLHALDSLCKLHGQFVDKMDARVKVGRDLSNLTDEELEQMRETAHKALLRIGPDGFPVKPPE